MPAGLMRKSLSIHQALVKQSTRYILAKKLWLWCRLIMLCVWSGSIRIFLLLW